MRKEFIENIDQIIALKLKELGLKPELPLPQFKELDKRFYSTPAKTKDGQTVFFKILISKEKLDGFFLKKEIALTKFLSDYSQKNLSLSALLFIDADTKNIPYWLMRQFLPGSVLGYHFELYQLGLKQDIQKKVLDNLFALQTIPCQKHKDVFEKIPLRVKTQKDYLNVLKRFENELNLYKSGAHKFDLDFKEIYHFFETQKQHLNPSNLVLAHGDLTLANFFAHKDKVYLTDWELALINNLSADIARMWIQTFRYPKWRKELITSFISKMPPDRKRDFQESFRIVALIEAVCEYFCNVLVTPRQTDIKESMRRTIALASKSFDDLINQKPKTL